MSATVKKNIELFATADGKPPSVVRGKIAGTQGILIPNSLLYLSQSGTWKAADTSDGTGDVVHGLFVGLDDTSSTWPIAAALTANTVIKVQLIDTEDLYAVYVENGGSDAAMSDSYKGNEYGLTISATAGQVGYVTMNVANSNDTVTVVDALANLETAKAAAADSPGVAIVKFLAAAVEAEKA